MLVHIRELNSLPILFTQTTTPELPLRIVSNEMQSATQGTPYKGNLCIVNAKGNRTV